ncbi:MAG: YceI family protein [Bacteroidota bacterium]|jgi:polyisoprenoid-binding protein YceI
MKTIIKTFIGTIFISLSAIAQTNWRADASHSKIGFSISHLMISEIEGNFKIYEGHVTTNKPDIDFSGATINFSVTASSINTDEEKRDAHLKGPDFFDVSKYPSITFKSTSIKPTKIKGTYVLEGDLTLHGVTKSITLTAVGSKKVVKDIFSFQRYAFKVTGSINRYDFDLKWNNPLLDGGYILDEIVKLNINLELIKEN